MILIKKKLKKLYRVIVRIEELWVQILICTPKTEDKGTFAKKLRSQNQFASKFVIQLLSGKFQIF